jgi:hypothetical protein
MGEERKVYKVLVGKSEGKRPLGSPRRRWEDGIRMDIREIGLRGCGLDSTGSGQGPVAGCCECSDEPSGSCATELVSGADTTGPLSTRFYAVQLKVVTRWIDIRGCGEAKGEWWGGW